LEWPAVSSRDETWVQKKNSEEKQEHLCFQAGGQPPEVREADALAAGQIWQLLRFFLSLHWGFLLLVCPKDCPHCDCLLSDLQQQEASGYCEHKEANQFRTAGSRSREI
jgi:hypothetical protein